MRLALIVLVLLPQEKTPWGSLEFKDDAVLLRVEAWPADGRVAMPRLNNPIRAVYRQDDAERKAVGFQPEIGEWIVSKPKDGAGGAIVVEDVGKPRRAGAEPPVAEPAADGSLTLPAHEAAPHGRMLRYEPQPHKNTVGYWVDENDWCEWRFRAAKPGRYKVLLLQGCGKGQGGSVVRIVVGGPPLDYTVEDTGHFQSFVERSAGTVTIEKEGPAALEIRVARKAKAAVMDVRQVRLVPE
jgi:hypothetical protein